MLASASRHLALCTKGPIVSAWCDRLVKGGIFFLILFTPFAFGSVHPWAYSIMEAVVFLLVAVWMLKVAVLATEQRAKGEGQRAEFGPQRSERFAPGALSLALFLLFVLFQLLPLPPSLLRVLSPQTFAYYIHSLPGWPEKVPYAEIGQKLEVGDQRSEVNGQRLEVRNLISDRGPLISGNWLPLSLAPALTRTDLLKFTAYAALFFLVL